MATRTGVAVQLVGNNNIGDTGIDGWQVTWSGMINGDVGSTVSYPGYADKSIQVEGTFGAGGSVACEGNNDGANFEPLTDPQGVIIGIATAGPRIKAITEAVINVRPRVTAGDLTTALVVTMFFRKTQNK
jgi:hypothetical protein